MHTWFTRRLLGLTLAAVFALPLPLQAADQDKPFTGILEVTLRKAVYHKGNQADNGQHVILQAEAKEGKWARAHAMALGFSNGNHSGFIDEATITDDHIEIVADMHMARDIWVPGGRGRWTVKLDRTKDGGWTGTYSGTWRGEKVSGKATGEIKPYRRILEEDFQPVTPDERPRVLLRANQLDHYRKKLKTPFGQAYYKKVAGGADIVNLALLYKLTGEEKFKIRIFKLIRDFKGDFSFDDFNGGFGSGGFGHRMVALLMTWDLLHGEWPEDLEKEFLKFARPYGHYWLKYLMTAHPNYHPCSNYYGPCRGAAGMTALTLWGLDGNEPVKPADPQQGAQEIKPDRSYSRGKGVPLVTFEAGKPIGDWIIAGPMSAKGSSNVLRTIGGYNGARPEIGTEASFLKVKGGAKLVRESVKFAPLPRAAGDEEGIHLDKLEQVDGPMRVMLFTAIKVEKDQVVGFVPDGRDVEVWVAGQKLDDKTFYQLRQGIYPVMMLVETGNTKRTVAPLLVSLKHEAMADRLALYELKLAQWKRDYAFWKAHGGADPSIAQMLDTARWTNYQHYRVGIGEGGFQAETGGYANIASWYPLVFATHYRKMFGRYASPDPDVKLLMPRRMMQVLFQKNGDSKVLKLNSACGVDSRWISAAFPIVPQQYKPYLLWAWNHIYRVEDANSAGNVLVDSGIQLAMEFLHYPLEMEPKHPSKGMPLTWHAPTFGFHCLRSGWDSDDDFIAQVFLKASMVGGWNHPNAGTFRLWGLGHPWATGSTSRKGIREQESVVLLPEDEKINQSGCGRLAFRDIDEQTGSGRLTIDMNDVYAGKKGRTYDGNLIRRPEGFADLGITGKRAFAFDYSGKSGAPCLMVLVDRIEGGGRKEWLWQLPTMPKTDLNYKVTVDHDRPGFTIDYGDASLQATFIAPSDVKIGRPNRQSVNKYHGVEKINWNAIVATGGDDFFVVVTIQKKDAPVVSAKGKGLDAEVTVGKQTISFDGEKIILGEK